MTETTNNGESIFRALHQREGCFVIPNPWDIGSACILASMGFEALATTSAGMAFALGRKEGMVTREDTLEYTVRVRPRAVEFAGRTFDASGEEVGWARWPRRIVDPVTGIAFRLIEPGEYRMGTDDGRFDEAPRHVVRITRPFYLGETEVTRGQWRAFVAATRL